jgi:hypothetical protein
MMVVLAQTEEGQDGDDHDDQADQIDNAVHWVTPLGLVPMPQRRDPDTGSLIFERPL